MTIHSVRTYNCLILTLTVLYKIGSARPRRNLSLKQTTLKIPFQLFFSGTNEVHQVAVVSSQKPGHSPTRLLPGGCVADPCTAIQTHSTSVTILVSLKIGNCYVFGFLVFCAFVFYLLDKICLVKLLGSRSAWFYFCLYKASPNIDHMMKYNQKCEVLTKVSIGCVKKRNKSERARRETTQTATYSKQG